MMIHNGDMFDNRNNKLGIEALLHNARQYSQTQRDGVTELWLPFNDMKTFPDELCVLFLNVNAIGLRKNMLCTIPASICSMTKLKRLYLEGNQLQRLPSAMTRLTNLERLFIGANEALPIELQTNVWTLDTTQSVLRQIYMHYAPIDMACKSTIIALLGVRKFRPIPAFAMIGKDVMAIIGKMMWDDCVSGEWGNKVYY